MLSPEQLFSTLPYGKAFLFAERISCVNEKEIVGSCFFPSAHPVYQDHFKNKSVLPGLIVIEGMGQVALVAHAIYLLDGAEEMLPVLHQIQADFHQIVPVDQSLKVKGRLIYFRNNTIKSEISLFDDQEVLLVSATALAKLINAEAI